MRNLGRCALLLAIISFTEGQKDIRMPPYIVKGPRSSAVFRSQDNVMLECKGGGIPDVSYQWKKNGLELNRNLPNIKSGADGTIIIEPATVIDEGYYQCFVWNQYGTALSDTSHMQKARLDSVSGSSNVYRKTAKEGEPFVIETQTGMSFPKPTYGWELATGASDNRPVPFRPSSRIQIDDNGNLHFAYAKPEDDLRERIYKCTAYNQYLDVKSGGSYTKVVVVRANGSQTSAPVLGFSSEPQTVGITGESVSLRCFFYGNLEPTISWKGPGNRLPANRWKLDKFSSELTIFNVTASDQGNYECSASNARGQISHTFQLRVEAKPSFRNNSLLGPRNINVTEGEDALFYCNADAVPEPGIVWLQNGNVLDVNFPPKKFSFSSDRKTLTIRNVCRDSGDCDDDPGGRTDLSVIQCNASNSHGYAFASGYLNVLAKTKIIPDQKKIEVAVGLDAEMRFDFDCSAVSDPSTPPKVRWLRVTNDGKEELVYNEPPAITLKQEAGEQSVTLSIFVSPNGTDRWLKYSGEYHCNAYNGYSMATKVVYLKVKNHEESRGSMKTWTMVLIIVTATLIVSFLLFFPLPWYYRAYSQRRPNVDRKIGFRKRASTPKQSTASNYETIPIDSLFATTHHLVSSNIGDPARPDTSPAGNSLQSYDAVQFNRSNTTTDGYEQLQYPPDPLSSTATGSDRHRRHGNEAQEGNGYCGLLNDRNISYLPLYSELRGRPNIEDANTM